MNWQCTCPNCGIVPVDYVARSFAYELVQRGVIRTCTISCKKCRDVEVTKEMIYYSNMTEITVKRGRPKKHSDNAEKQKAYRSKKALRKSDENQNGVTKKKNG